MSMCHFSSTKCGGQGKKEIKMQMGKGLGYDVKDEDC